MTTTKLLLVGSNISLHGETGYLEALLAMKFAHRIETTQNDQVWHIKNEGYLYSLWTTPVVLLFWCYPEPSAVGSCCGAI
jgi:hypothetical protein